MNDTDDLAQRYLALWMEYLAALLADPRALETLRRWMSFAGKFSYPGSGEPPPGGVPAGVWPPFFAPFGPPMIPPSVGGGAGQADAIAALAERVDALDARLVALEHKIGSRPRGATRVRKRPAPP
jgi:hypothetical protein